MRKLNYLIAGLVMAAAIVSCDKEMMDDSQLMDKKSTGTIVASSPESDAGVTPYIIPGQNRGGNRTCEEVAKAFNTSFDYSSGKIDYEDGEFEGEFPVGLNVTVDGKYVSFDIPGGCLLIDGKYYKVGAVIVKGGPKANVYYYPDGISKDGGLASPVNASGGPAGLSNLTFCFVECDGEPEPLVIAVKAMYDHQGVYPYRWEQWAVSVGEYIFETGSWRCDRLGVNDITVPEFLMHNLTYLWNVGTVQVQDNGGSWTIIVEFFESLAIEQAWVYIGTEAALFADGSCPDYLNDWETSTDVVDNKITFVINK